MENNRKVREELWKSVEELNDQQLNTVVKEGKWTIAQVLMHLYLVEMGVAKGIQHSYSENVNPSKLRAVHLVAERTEKLAAPENFVPNKTNRTLDDLKNKLGNSRKVLIDHLKGVSEEELTQKYLPHPYYRSLSLKQWVELIGYHELRHIKQIEEIKVELLEQIPDQMKKRM